MNQVTTKLFTWAKELQAISTSGRFYTKDRFDKERFDRLLEISAEMSATISDDDFETIKGLFTKETIYQPPKIDSRAIIFNEKDEVLLIEELDHRWAPPGGWCEHDLPPAQNTVKEAWEEAGLNVEVKRLVAVHDQRIHNEPYQFFSVQRFLFLCEVKSGSFQENIETLGSGWFSLDALPTLHSHKCSLEQLKMCLRAKYAEAWETEFD